MLNLISVEMFLTIIIKLQLPDGSVLVLLMTRIIWLKKAFKKFSREWWNLKLTWHHRKNMETLKLRDNPLLGRGWLGNSHSFSHLFSSHTKCTSIVAREKLEICRFSKPRRHPLRFQWQISDFELLLNAQ